MNPEGSRTDTWNRRRKPGNRRPQPLRFPGKSLFVIRGNHVSRSSGRGLRGNPRRGGRTDLRELLLGHNDPGDDVGEQSAAAEDHQGDPENPDQAGIQVQIVCEARADTGDLSVGPRAGERFAGRGRVEKRRAALATEVHPVSKLFSTVWAEHVRLLSRIWIQSSIRHGVRESSVCGCPLPAVPPRPSSACQQNSSRGA